MGTTNIPPASDFDRETVKTTVTSFRIIEAMRDGDGKRVDELAAELDLAEGTVYKHLASLRTLNYVVHEDERFRLSLRFMGLGTGVRSKLDIYEKAYEPVEKLADATDEVGSLMVPEHGYGVYVLRVRSENRPDVAINEGESVPLTATAGGKAILSYTPEDERERIIEQHGLPELTDNTITDRAELRRELRSVRDRRRAYDNGEFLPDRHCVAAPILDENGVAIAAVTVSGPADRMSEKVAQADFASLIGSTMDSIESRLGTQ